ncbi:hypothetical protein [Methylovirgula sp. HY1]|uniref:hypothetical protein n=1 Tax=Methylovirgula sp. HY1 TaxID=2822761 RepID=UPI001C5BD504|nr:hypothetical protein [Methylovirgula sp. HY1]
MSAITKSTVYDPSGGPSIGPVFAYSIINAFIVALKYIKLIFFSKKCPASLLVGSLKAGASN